MSRILTKKQQQDQDEKVAREDWNKNKDTYILEFLRKVSLDKYVENFKVFQWHIRVFPKYIINVDIKGKRMDKINYELFGETSRLCMSIHTNCTKLDDFVHNCRVYVNYLMEINSHKEEQAKIITVRRQALSKLSEEEKRVLGIEDLPVKKVGGIRMLEEGDLDFSNL